MKKYSYHRLSYVGRGLAALAVVFCTALSLFGQQEQAEKTSANRLFEFIMTNAMSNTEKMHQQLSRNLSAYMIYQQASQLRDPYGAEDFIFDRIIDEAFPPHDHYGTEFDIRFQKSTVELPEYDKVDGTIVLEYRWPGMQLHYSFDSTLAGIYFSMTSVTGISQTTGVPIRLCVTTSRCGITTTTPSLKK